MPKNQLDKQSVPIFYDQDNNPIGILLLHNRQRLVFTIKLADEDEIIDIFKAKSPIHKEKKDDSI